MARSTFEPRTFAVNPDGIIELFINAKYMPIVAAPYDGDELRVDYYTSPEYPYDARTRSAAWLKKRLCAVA